MDSGVYAACAGLVAKIRALDSSAHNLANISTTAFKGERVGFQALLAQSNGSRLSGVNQAINSFGVTDVPTRDLSQGSVERTGNPLDIAIEGPGYLALQTASGQAFTRNGHLEISASGQLVSAGGNVVLGDQGPITLPAGTVSISSGGVISVNGALVATLKLAEFAPHASIQETSPGVFLADAAPVAATRSMVRQGALEAANVNPVDSAVGLITIQREAQMLQRALSLLHGEMNRVATTDLARV
jgi:flagellar basal-body rod protein FlgF/flagellar basal-body rod protein FlgG